MPHACTPVPVPDTLPAKNLQQHNAMFVSKHEYFKTNKAQLRLTTAFTASADRGCAAAVGRGQAVRSSFLPLRGCGKSVCCFKFFFFSISFILDYVLVSVAESRRGRDVYLVCSTPVVCVCDCGVMTHAWHDEPHIPVAIATLWRAPPTSRNTKPLYLVSMSKISPSFVGLALVLAVAQRSCYCTSTLVLPDTAASASVGHPASTTRTSFVSTPFLARLHKRTLAMTQADSGATSPVQTTHSSGDSTAEGESTQRYGSSMR